MKEEKFDVLGMTCSSCSSHVEKAVKKLNGINEVNVNLLSNSMTVKYNEETLNTNEIIQAVIKINNLNIVFNSFNVYCNASYAF